MNSKCHARYKICFAPQCLQCKVHPQCRNRLFTTGRICPNSYFPAALNRGFYRSEAWTWGHLERTLYSIKDLRGTYVYFHFQLIRANRIPCLFQFQMPKKQNQQKFEWNETLRNCFYNVPTKVSALFSVQESPMHCLMQLDLLIFLKITTTLTPLLVNLVAF